jgi:hypothetical protein
LRSRLEHAAGRGDVRKIVDNLNRAYDDGKLGGDKTVLRNFLGDLARNLNSKTPAGNRQVCALVAQAHVAAAIDLSHFQPLTPRREFRWCDSTKALYEVLLFWAGPRVTDLLRLNLSGPALSTLRSGLREEVNPPHV